MNSTISQFAIIRFHVTMIFFLLKTSCNVLQMCHITFNVNLNSVPLVFQGVQVDAFLQESLLQRLQDDSMLVISAVIQLDEVRI